MKVLQTKRKGCTETNNIDNVSNVSLDGGFVDNRILIGFGMRRQCIELAFAKDDTYRLAKLYNEIILSIHNNDLTYLSVEFDENNFVNQWFWHDDFEDLLVEFPKKEYSVVVSYKTSFEVNVEASSESEAYEKAIEKHDTSDDEIPAQLIDNMEESGHTVTELK